MKLTQELPKFGPIIVTLETAEEAVEFYLRYNTSSVLVAESNTGVAKCTEEVVYTFLEELGVAYKCWSEISTLIKPLADAQFGKR